MDHKEDFEVVTSPDGSSTLSICVACATVREHYDRTTTAHSTVASDPAEVCSTGLRVYEGAQVLAAFLVRYGVGLLPACSCAAPEGAVNGAGNSGKLENVPSSSSTNVVELGCGCGLAGFTLDATIRTHFECPRRSTVKNSSETTATPGVAARIIFTDASTNCLALVRRSGQLAGRSVRDLDAAGSAGSSVAPPAPSSFVELSTCPLAWSELGVSLLRRHLSPSGTAKLIFGSDLMYYRVDINALVNAARRLLTEHPHRAPFEAAPPSGGIIVFAHFMRIPDGQRTLAMIAREDHRLSIATVPLTAFLSADTIRARAWNGIELVVLTPRPSPVSYFNRDGGTKREEEDVCQLHALLAAQADDWEKFAEASPAHAEGATAAAAQARRLAQAMRPYPSYILENRGNGKVGGGAPDAEALEEDAFLNLLL